MFKYSKHHQYYLLRYGRARNECFTRIDRYRIIRFWVNHKGKQLQEMLFYPSKQGREEIRNLIALEKSGADMKSKRNIIERYHKLLQHGDAHICTNHCGYGKLCQYNYGDGPVSRKLKRRK